MIYSAGTIYTVFIRLWAKRILLKLTFSEIWAKEGVSPYSQEFEDMRKDPIVRFAREGHIFFLKLLSFTVVKSLVTNGSRLEAKCFGFIFRFWLWWFYKFKV